MKFRKPLGQITKMLRKAQTPWEAKLWKYLRGARFHGFKFKRQVPMGKYVVDFCCQEKKLIIELDGGHHSELSSRVTDWEKRAYLESIGYRVLSFWNNEIENNLEGVYGAIEENLKGDLSPDLSPSPGERVF